MPKIKMVMDYSNMDFEKVMLLPCDLFLQMLKNQYINNLNQSKEGKQYLADCKRYKSTAPDMKAIRNKLKKG